MRNVLEGHNRSSRNGRSMAKVFVAQGLDQPQAFSLIKSLVTLGRSGNCDIVLSNPVVSRMHAEIIEEAGHFYLSDLDSRNGTRLNGSRISNRSLLKDGDLIQLDDVVLQFRSTDDEPWNDSSSEASPSKPDQEDHVIATMDLDTGLRLTENSEQKLSAIVELSRNIGVSLDIDAVLPRVLESLMEIFSKADWVSIVLLRDDRLVPYAVKSRNPGEGDSDTMAPISHTIMRRVLSEKVAILSSDVLADNRFKESPSVLEIGIRSMICAPLIGPSTKPVGVLMADVRELDQPFDERDLDVLVTVSRMVAQNMDYVRLHEQLIEERHRAEATLRKSNETLKTLINSSPLAMFLLDRSGRVTRVWNPAAQTLFGWTPEQVFGKGLKIIAHEDQQIFHDFCYRVTNGESFTSAEISCHTRGGDLIDVELSAAPLPADGEQVAEMIFIAADVTELKRTREIILQKERLATIGETMASLTHESRNALHRIQLGLEVFQRNCRPSPETDRIADEVRQACSDLQYLYENVRQFSAAICLEKKCVDLLDLIRQAWESLTEVRSDCHATLEIHSQLDELYCHIDVMRIEQVFRNLFENSLDGCPDPVKIDITIAPDDERQSIRVTVRDNGPGLNLEQRQCIFEPFYTTKSTGTGLGMAIVRRIVEAHGGHIDLGSPDNQGAEFVIIIPI